MSIVTKVFVVLLTVFSIAFAMATVSFVARQENWRQLASDYRATALSAQAATKLVTAQMKLTHDQDLARIGQLKNQTAGLARQLADQSAQLDELTNRIAQQQNQITSLTGSLKGVEETLGVTQTQLISEQDFARRLASRNNELERRNVDLNERVKDLTIGLAMAHQQNKAYLEQIASMEQHLERVARGPALQTPDAAVSMQAAAPSAAPQIISPVSPVRGEITEVRGKLASISVGSADGVMRGMSFMIYRGGKTKAEPEYIGTLEISRVETHRAAGTIVRSPQQVLVGDMVRDEASFARNG